MCVETGVVSWRSAVRIMEILVGFSVICLQHEDHNHDMRTVHRIRTIYQVTTKSSRLEMKTIHVS